MKGSLAEGGSATGVNGFLRHVAACHSARLPSDRLPFRLRGQLVGWLAPSIVEALRSFPSVQTATDGITLGDPSALPEIAADLARRGLFRWRGEAFDVRGNLDGPALAQVDRGALPAFGIAAEGAHLNGMVRRADGPYLWVAYRAADKALDPGKLDHVAAGGVPAGMSPFETLVKEAGEEAAIPPALARQARLVARISYATDRPEGLRRDRIHCYDLDLPEEWLPRAADGEVDRFELWPIERVLETVRETDRFKFNVNLVLIDLFLRLGLIAGEAGAVLRRGLDAGGS